MRTDLKNIKSIYKHEILPLNDLHVPERYQRELNERRMERIAEDFNPLAVGALVVIRKPGKGRKAKPGTAFLMDGEHRRGALYMKGYTHWHCLVIEDDLQVWEQAKTWKGFNQNRANASPLELFKADLAAKQQQAIDIKEIIEKFGWGIPTKAPASGASLPYGMVSAVATLRDIHKRMGKGGLYTVIDVLVRAWGDHEDRRIHHGDFMKAIAKIVATETVQDHSEWAIEHLVKKLSRVQPSKIENLAKSRRDQNKESKYMCISVEIAKLFNTGLGRNTGKRIVVQ